MKKSFNCIISMIIFIVGFITIQMVKAEDNTYEPKVYVEMQFQNYQDRYNSVLQMGIQLQKQREEEEKQKALNEEYERSRL